MKTWLNTFENCCTYKEAAVLCKLTEDEFREALLGNIEQVSIQIEDCQKELAMWVDYTPKNVDFLRKVPEVVGRNAGMIFALREEFAELIQLRYKFEVNSG